MKIKLTHIGKRTLASILCILMLFSMMIVGTIPAAAYGINKGVTIWFDNTSTKWSNVELYIFKSDGYNETVQFTQSGTTNFWYHTFTTGWGVDGLGGYQGIIFRSDSNWTHQTANIEQDVTSAVTCFTPNSTTGKMSCNTTYTVGVKSASITKNTTVTNSGSGTSSSPYIVYEGTAITAKADCTLISSSTGKRFAFNGGTTYSSTSTYTVTSSAVAGQTYSVYANAKAYYSSKYSKNAVKSDTLYFKAVPKTYNVVVSAGTGGSVSPSGTKSVGSEGISVTATPNTGYAFSSWAVTGGAKVSSANSNPTTLTATAAGTLKAQFVKKDYAITYTKGDNFTYSGTSSTAQYLDEVTFTVTPNAGYKIGNVTAKNNTTSASIAVTNNGDNTYTFTMPASAVTVNATAILDLQPLDTPIVTSNAGTSGLTIERGSPLQISVSNEYPDGTALKFTLDGQEYNMENGSIDTSSLSTGQHSLKVKASCAGYADSAEAEFVFNVATIKRTVTVSSANAAVTQLEVSYTKEEKPTSETISDVVTGKEISVDKDCEVTVTATLKTDNTGNDVANIAKWTIDSVDKNSTDTSYTLSSVSDDATVKVTAYGDIKVSDYDISNTWISPDDTTDVTVVMGGSHDKAELSATYKTVAYLYSSSGELVYTSPLSDSANESVENKGIKVTFNPVNISYATQGTYDVTVAIFGYDSNGEQVAYGYLAESGRELTISTEPAKVTLTARLSAKTDAGVTIQEGKSGNIIQGENVTLTGYCNNGNKPAGTYKENSVTKYKYDYYYYTDNVENSTHIGSATDQDVKFDGTTPVTQTSVVFKVPESDTPDTKYNFYVKITAMSGDDEISNPCSSLERGPVTGIVKEATIAIPEWADNYVYFHTIGDNISDSQAWTAMETYTSTKDGTIRVGTYSSATSFQVFLPETAVNTSGKNKDTYLVYNNTSNTVIFTGTSIKTATIRPGETAYVPKDVTNFQYTPTSAGRTLNIYTSKAEENAYVNVNITENPDEKTIDAKKANVTSGSQLINALCFNQKGGTKADAVVKNPRITLVQSNGIVDVSELSKQIKGRGNTTWSGTQKKSFNFTLNSKASVSGMAKGKKYSLLANYQDPSLARNRFLLDLADSVGIPYASDSRFTDFYVNGLYAGSYLLTEKYDAIENDLNDTVPDGITFNGTGSVVTNMDFMIELACNTQGDDMEIKPFSKATGDGILSVTLPDPGDIDEAITAGTLTEANKTAITNFIQSKYEALYTALSNSKTTKEQLEALIDVESLAKVYLINEIAKNYDSGVSSFYLSYVDGKFKASPVWDFDNSLGNPNTSPTEAPDYKQPSGWWCKYWRGNSNNYTKNFVNAAANSSIVMEAAKAAWFGTSSSDTTSFVYNLNKFSTDTSTSADLGKDTGLLTKAYYLSVLQKSAENNFRKWSIVPNDWVSGHEELTMYGLDYDSFLTMVDYNTYELGNGYTHDSDVFTSALTKTAHHYTQSDITSTSSRNGGQYEFAADYMSSRAAWLTYNFLAGTSYYLSGSFNGFTTQADDDYRLVEIETGSGIYAIRNIDRSLVCGSEVYFKLNNGSAYIGPAENTDLSTVSSYHSRTAYKTTGTVEERDAYASLTAKNVPTTWTKVNVYYQPSTKSVWIAQYVADKYTEATVTLSTENNEVEYNSLATLTATATGVKVSIDGGTSTNYTGDYVYEFYRMLGEEPAPENDKLIKSVTTSENTCEASARIRDVYSFYVVVYPAVEPSVTKTSEIVTIDGGAEEKSVEVPLYIDFAKAEVSENPVVTTVDNAGKTTDYTLTKLGESNIYSTTVNFGYLLGLNDKVYDDFDIQKITVGDIVVALTDSTQPHAQTLKDAGDSRAIWLKANTDTLTTNYEDFTYKIDTSLRLKDITDTPVETETAVSSTTKRIYFSDNVWKSGTPFIYHDRMSSWDSAIPMTFIKANDMGENVYYSNVPADATVVVFRDHGKTKQTTDVAFDSSVTSTSNNHFYIAKDGDNAQMDGTKYKIASTNAVAPVVTSYVSEVYLSVDSTADITPETPSGVTYTCTSNSSSIVSVSSTDGCVITGKSAGTTIVTITPKGSNGDSGTAVKVNVHVVDKTTLNNYLANAKKIIDEEEGNSVYTDLTYDDVVHAYEDGLEVYQTSYRTADINNAVAQLKAAFDQLEKAPTNDELDLISYKTAVVTVQSDGNGEISKPETNGYVQEDMKQGIKMYTVTYAANDGTAEFEFNLTSTATPSERFLFAGWKMGEGLIGDAENPVLSITEAPAEDVVYTATFASNNQTAVTLVYKFQDYDTSDGVYYYDADKDTIATEYQTHVIIDNDSLNNETVKAAIENDENVPTIRSNYFDYELLEEHENFSYDPETHIASVNLTETPHEYKINVIDKGGSTHKGTGYYQNQFTLNASNYGFDEGDEVYWAIVNEDGEKSPITTHSTYTFRITVDGLTLQVLSRDGQEIDLDGDSSVSTGYYELSYSGESNQKITQNFYIADYFTDVAYDDKGDVIADATDVEFVGGGVLYCSVNADGTYSNNSVADVLKDKESRTNFIKNRCGSDYNTSISAHTDPTTKLGYRYLSAADDADGNIFRYSESLQAYQYIFAATFNNNPANADKKMRLYSFYVYSYKDSSGSKHYQVSVSDGYAEASMYQG